MTTAKSEPGLDTLSSLADGDPKPRRFTASELQAMLDAGIITAGEMPGTPRRQTPALHPRRIPRHGRTPAFSPLTNESSW